MHGSVTSTPIRAEHKVRPIVTREGLLLVRGRHEGAIALSDWVEVSDRDGGVVVVEAGAVAVDIDEEAWW